MQNSVGRPVQVTRRVRFSAARRLHSDALDGAANERLFGPDQRLHGREFSLYVTLEGPAPSATGMVMDLKALSLLLKSEVVAELDRRVLNEVAFVAGLPPTTENLAALIWRRLEPRLPTGTLRRIRLDEGEDKSVSYCGD